MIRRYLLDTGIAQDFQDDRRGVRARAKEARLLGHRWVARLASSRGPQAQETWG